jgi:hypothetical protein
MLLRWKPKKKGQGVHIARCPPRYHSSTCIPPCYHPKQLCLNLRAYPEMSWLKGKDWRTGVEYSSLFHSGLWAISLGSRARLARACSIGSTSRRERVQSQIPSACTHKTRRRRRPSLPGLVTDSSLAPPPRPARAQPRPASVAVFNVVTVRPTKSDSV